MRFLLPVLVCLVLGIPSVAPAAEKQDYKARVMRLLKRTPLVDGHNDLPWALRASLKGKAAQADLNADGRAADPSRHTDLPRLKAGGVGGQFWSVWVPPNLADAEAVKVTMEQIDLVKSFCSRYPRDFEMAFDASAVHRIYRSGRIACLIGVEGGHQIGGSLAVLRQYHALGARYLTLTHGMTTAWADSATDDPRHGGLTDFGRQVVAELNRLGMLVDLSHVSPEVMAQTLEITRAPVIFSHSNARALNDHPRGVPDNILRQVGRNGGVVMVNFAPDFVSAERALWSASHEAESTRLSAPFLGIYTGQPKRVAAAMAEWRRLNPKPKVTLAQVADHIDHIRKVAGIDHVGIGADFDGISDPPSGLAGVEAYPALFEEMMRRGWTDADLEKLASGNVLRAMAQAECIARVLAAGNGENWVRCRSQ